jgi:hypothetical protein
MADKVKLTIHPVDPHYSHDFADLYFEGKHFCVTASKRSPVTPLEVLGFFESRKAAGRALLASSAKGE